MISSELVFVQLAQVDDYIGIVELSMMLEASVSQVRHRLKELGERVEYNNKDEWRVVRNVVPRNLLSEADRTKRDSLESTVQQAFFVAGKALKELRDLRLYRETHDTFESYVRDRFDVYIPDSDSTITVSKLFVYPDFSKTVGQIEKNPRKNITPSKNNPRKTRRKKGQGNGREQSEKVGLVLARSRAARRVGGQAVASQES